TTRWKTVARKRGFARLLAPFNADVRRLRSLKATMSEMLTPRIAPIEPPYRPEVQAEFDKLMRGAPPLLLFRTVARNPRVLQRMMAGSLLDRGSISLRSRELMILRTCARCGAEYEWGVHIATFGAKVQWTPVQIRSTAYGGA